MPVPFACCWSNGGNLTPNKAAERSCRTTLEELNKLHSSPEYNEWMKKKRYSGYPTVIAILLIGLLLASTPKIWRTSQKGHKIDEAQPSNILTGHEIDQPTQKKITPVAPLPSTVVCNCPQPDYQETPQIKQEKEALREQIKSLQMKLMELTAESEKQKDEHKEIGVQYKRLLVAYQAGFIAMMLVLWKGWNIHAQRVDKLKKEKLAIHLEERGKLLKERNSLRNQASELDSLREECKSLRYDVQALTIKRKECEKLKTECDELKDKCESLKTISSVNLSLLTRKKSLEVQVDRVRELQDVINVLEPKAAKLPELRDKQYELLARCGTCSKLQDRLKKLQNEAGELPNLQNQCQILHKEVKKVLKLREDCEKLRKTACRLEPMQKMKKKLLTWVETVRDLETECSSVHKNLQIYVQKLQGSTLERLQLVENAKVDDLVDELINEL